MRKNTKFGINALIITLVTVAAVILVNAVITTLAGKTSLKIDLTRDKVYEFSEHTKETMKKLDKEIVVYALYPANTDANEFTTYAEEYLGKYSELNKNFKVKFIDPYTNPNFAKQYEKQGKNVEAGAIILTCGDKFEVVHFQQMYSSNQYNNSVNIDMEKAITSAITKVTGQVDTVKVYFVEGHDEYPPTQLPSVLMENGYEVDTLNMGANGIPEDASMLVFFTPSKDLTVEERDALDAYLDGGGKALFAFDAGMTAPERLGEYLAEWGLVPQGDFIEEGDSGSKFLLGGVEVSVPLYFQHKINDSLVDQKLVFMTPTMSSIAVNENNIRRTQITPLLGTSESAWGNVDLASTGKDEGDNEGPLVVAAISEMPDASRSSVTVIGSVTAIEAEGILQEPSFANGDFLLNTIGYITEADDNMNIRAKRITAPGLTMKLNQVVIMVIILQYVLPLLIIIIGLIVWLKRRYK